MLQEVSVLQRLNQAKSKNPSRFNIRAIVWSTLLLIISGIVVCMPLLVGEEADDCLGVLCFDSYNQTNFDTSVVQNGLRLLARRISLLLLMHEKFKKEVFS